MADPVLDRAVEVVVEGNAEFLRSEKECVADRRRIDGIGHPEWTAILMIGVVELLVVLAALEVGKNLAIAPAGCAGLARPSVVIFGVAARVKLSVDRRSASDHLGLSVPNDTAVEMLLRDCAPPPARDSFGHFGEARRHYEQRIPVGAAGLEEKNVDRRISAQTVGQDATR